MSKLIVEPFLLDHCRAVGQPDLNTATVNQISGPAFTLIQDGRILAMGGVRVRGIGEAWMMLLPEAERHAKTVVRTARAVITESMADEKLYCIYAQASGADPKYAKFLQVLGFVPRSDTFVR